MCFNFDGKPQHATIPLNIDLIVMCRMLFYNDFDIMFCGFRHVSALAGEIMEDIF